MTRGRGVKTPIFFPAPMFLLNQIYPPCAWRILLFSSFLPWISSLRLLPFHEPWLADVFFSYLHQSLLWVLFTYKPLEALYVKTIGLSTGFLTLLSFSKKQFFLHLLNKFKKKKNSIFNQMVSQKKKKTKIQCQNSAAISICSKPKR